MSNKEKATLVPKLRFSEFQGDPEWKSSKVSALVDTVAPPKRLPTSSYLLKGEFPIIDQSQNPVCGWTDDREALIQGAFPLIVFGDHTCILKLVDRPFAQGADGIKILRSRPAVDSRYLYQFLGYKPVATEEYKRHFSTLKEKEVLLPDIKTGEQKKIADCLTSLDELIASQAHKVDALKLQKKGLMLKLFPREGEYKPRLRVPEFRDAGDWQKQKLSALIVRSVNPVDVDPVAVYREIGIRSHGKGIFHKEPVRGQVLGEKKVFWVAEHALVINIVFAWEQALAVTSPAEEGMIASHRFPMFKAKPGKADVGFIKYFFLTEKGKELLGIASPGGAGRNKTLGRKDFNNLEFLVPGNVEEQKIISDLLSSIDALIASETRRVETLETHKRGLMQQLFPPSGALEA